ncbi:MAG: CheB methylesterase domain-containing protein [Defluviitaleaceae bacterium]|nr:CheB methylesterase domain-containing protein [Defluviitaleaceae bacterium]
MAYADKVVAIAASTGGVEALGQVFADLPSNIPPTLLVIHMPPGFTKLFAARFNETYKVTMKEADTGDYLLPGQVLVAPAGRHMKVVSTGGRLTVECFVGEKVRYVIPSADVMFDSVANVLGNRAVGVILTGMGADGADGLLRMRRTGASTIGQNRETSTIYGMPKVAMELGAVEHQLPLDQIAAKIMSLVQR